MQHYHGVICASGLCDLTLSLKVQLLLVFACDSFPGGQARISYSHLYATTALDKWPEIWLNSLPPLIQRTAVPLKDVLAANLVF